MRISTINRPLCPRCGGPEEPVTSLGKSTLAKGQTRCPECSDFRIVLHMDPPTVTHHAKKRVTYRRRDKVVHGLADSAELSNVRRSYAIMLASKGVVEHKPPKPLLGPIYLSMAFVFRGAASAWYTEKPDDDNLCKTLQDVLVSMGWLAADKLVCRKWIDKMTDPKPHILIDSHVIKEYP